MSTALQRARRGIRGLLPIATLVAISLTTRSSFADHYYVPSGSMEPTVAIGDRIFVNKAAYGLRLPLTEQWLWRYGSPARGDVVILEADSPDVLLKRVVAVSGDVVEVKAGRVYIDQTLIAEPRIKLEDDGGPDFGPIQVPADKVLVLGDNRGNSRDGRVFGFVDRKQILGRAVAVIAHDSKPTLKGL